MTNRTISQSPLLSTTAFTTILWLLFALSPAVYFLAASEEDDSLTTQEMESISKAKDSDQKLKIYLEIASHRMKEIIQFAGKEDKENTPKAVKAYQTACTGAEKCVVESSSDTKINKKMVETLYKTLQGYNATLVRAMEKTPDDFRPQIESAFNVSTGIQQGMSIRAGRYGIK